MRHDQLRDLLDTILATLDEDVAGEALAGRAYLSRFHFDRLVAAGVGEGPAAFRRRLLLERAAWRLTGGMSVTDAGLEAGYGATEAFSRAFSRAFGVKPSHFTGDFRLPARNGIHFHGPAGLRLPGTQKGRPMDLTDRLLEHDHWVTTQLVEQACELTDEQLDREIRPGHVVLSYDGPEPTARAMVDRLIWTKEIWSAAISGREFPSGADTSAPALRARWSRASEEFRTIATGIRDRDEWNEVFVDALCHPPQSFTFGGVLAHVITFAAHRRQVLVGALTELGATPVEPCPMEWERLHAASRSHPSSTLRGTKEES